MVLTLTAISCAFAGGVVVGRHMPKSVEFGPSEVSSVNPPSVERVEAPIPEETFTLFDKIPDSRGRRGRSSAEGSGAAAAPSTVAQAPTPTKLPADGELPSDGNGSGAEAVGPARPVTASATPVPAPAHTGGTSSVSGTGATATPPAPAGRAADAPPTQEAPPRTLQRSVATNGTFDFEAGSASNWDQAQRVSDSLRAGGLKTTVNATRDAQGHQRFVVRVHGTGDAGERSRQEQVARRLVAR
jgi:hypothetical protein